MSRRAAFTLGATLATVLVAYAHLVAAVGRADDIDGTWPWTTS